MNLKPVGMYRFRRRWYWPLLPRLLAIWRERLNGLMNQARTANRYVVQTWTDPVNFPASLGIEKLYLELADAESFYWAVNEETVGVYGGVRILSPQGRFIRARQFGPTREEKVQGKSVFGPADGETAGVVPLKNQTKERILDP